eukprot:gene8821-11910_t
MSIRNFFQLKSSDTGVIADKSNRIEIPEDIVSSTSEINKSIDTTSAKRKFTTENYQDQLINSDRDSNKLLKKSVDDLSKKNEGSENASLLSNSENTKNDSEPLNLIESLDKDWVERLKGEFSKPYFLRLSKFVTNEYATQTVYPPISQLYTAFNSCPIDEIKVVIIGQDPYHGPGQAHGLSFSVLRGIPLPMSLKNIINEARSDPTLKVAVPTHGCLESWSRQGVFLLNACLTVRKGEPNSHQKKGWEEFTDAVIRELGKRQNIVYLLWGNSAQAKCESISAKNNVIIKSSHPSPLGASKTNQPFTGSRCFTRCNEALVGMGKEPIDWNIR